MLATDVKFDPTRQLSMEWSVEKGLVKREGVGGVNGGHRNLLYF